MKTRNYGTNAHLVYFAGSMQAPAMRQTQTPLKVPAAEFQRNIGRYQDVALNQPVAVTRNGRDYTVLISAEEYARLKARDRQVMTLADFTAADLTALENSPPPAEAADFDDEMMA